MFSLEPHCVKSNTISNRIRWATYKSKLGSKEPKQDVLETSPVHVSFISYQVRLYRASASPTDA